MKKKEYSYGVEEVAGACRQSISSVKMAEQRGKLRMADLRDVARFIVSRMLSDRKKEEE